MTPNKKECKKAGNKNTSGIQRPKLIVMPFQPAIGQSFDGVGLGIHFFLGNLFGVHGGLAECWFGWRVKKIFPEIGLLKDYCRAHKPFSDIQALGIRENVRFWLEGQYKPEGETISLFLVLHDTQEGMPESKIKLSMGLSDGLMGVRIEIFDWLERCGLAFVGIEKASWPEHITFRGLDFLGRALETTYLNYIQGGSPADFIDLTWFDRAVDASKNSYLAQDLKGWGLYKNREYEMAKNAFASALALNPTGSGALSGMMWCALSVKNRERALEYALAKAGCRGESLEKARAFVDKKLEN